MSDIRTAVAKLAEYMTDSSRVVKHSMGLTIPTQRAEAQAFFDLREAWGVGGYATAEEAIKAIEGTLS